MPRFEEIRPEPARFWVRWAPREWRGPEEPFLDLARGRLAPAALRRGGESTALPAAPADTLYLPPVGDGATAWRRDWIERAAGAGHAVLVQVPAGEESPEGAATLVADLTGALLDGELDRLTKAPANAVAAWPLIAGVTDDPETLRAGCARLRDAGVRAVQGIVPELDPAERRRLSQEGGEEVYQALFHGPPASPLPLARVVVEHRMSPWLERPGLAVPASGRRSRNRALAGHLAILAEWRLLLGHPESGAQALFHAARWVDEETRDVVAIANEGNLSIVDWLEPRSREEIERFAGGGGEAALAELTDALLAST